MAEETPQQAAGAATSAGEAVPETKPTGGFRNFLPLVAAVVLMPVIAFGTFKVKSLMGGKKDTSDAASAAESEPADKHEAKAEKHEPAAHGSSSSAHGSSKKGASIPKGDRDTKMWVPLSRYPIAYKPADPEKPYDTPKYVVLDMKGDPKEVADAEKIVVNISKTGGTRYAVGRFSMRSEDKDFIALINLNREKLIDKAHGALSSKTLEDFDTPGFKNILRSELIQAFNGVLAPATVKDLNVETIVQ